MNTVLRINMGATGGPEATKASPGKYAGLVGAVMRVGSYLAPFRKNISETRTSDKTERTAGCIKIKLFNIILRDSGAGFLERGILLAPRQLEDFFSCRDEGFFNGCSHFQAGNRVLTPGPMVIQEAAPGQEIVKFHAVTVENATTAGR